MSRFETKPHSLKTPFVIAAPFHRLWVHVVRLLDTVIL
jgi:hypothetical protein